MGSHGRALWVAVGMVTAAAAWSSGDERDGRVGLPAYVGPPAYDVTTIAGGLTYPWSLAFTPSGDVLITEKPGRLRIVRNNLLVAASVPGMPIVTNLLDIAVDPDFDTTHAVFVSYTRTQRDGSSGNYISGLEVLRAQLLHDELIASRVIFAATPKLPDLLHFGGRMLFLPDKSLLISVGDGSEDGLHAQAAAGNLGAVVRIRRDGSIPSDNPFAGRSGGRAAVFTHGHRNIQGLARRDNGEIWSVEHGPVGGDELNRLVSGSNYGWPFATFGDHALARRSTDASQVLVDPVLSWTPAVAPSGMAFYDGDLFASWRGHLFVGSLARRALLRLDVVGTPILEEVMLTEVGERIRDVRVHSDGCLYVLTDSASGRLLRIEPHRSLEAWSDEPPTDAWPEVRQRVR